MALIKCNECGNEISDKSTHCIHCGCPIEKKVFCGECGHEALSSHNICSNCGCPLNNNSNINNNSGGSNYSNNVSPVTSKNTNDSSNGLCLAGMIVGIISFFIDFFGLVALVGLIMSIVGYNQVKETPGTNLNRARIGMVCSGIELFLKVIQLMSLMTFY
jgi:hypothetical protein